MKASSKRRRGGIILAAVAASAVGLILAVGANANLAGSSFEGNDGNLVSNGGKDWAGTGANAAPNVAAGQDLASGGGDNSFGNGTSENDINVTVIDGSIPNSKADLARFAIAGETIGLNSYLYLAWTRENDSGSVNYDFEINAAEQPNLTTLGPKTLVRTAGDLNISYAFQGNNLTPALSVRVWSGTAWGTEQPLTGCSEGLGNSATVADTLGGLGSVNRTTGRFGEAAVNLTCAGIVQSGSCSPFSSAYMKSRASQSFNSEIKDFIAPIHLSLSNCGQIKVIKRTNPRGLDQPFSYTTSANVPGGGFSLNDKDGGTGDSANNTKTYSALQGGTYTFTEGADPSGFAFASLTCTGGGANTSTAGKVATVGLDPNETVECVYVNDQQLGAIKVSKSSIKGNTALAGGKFTVAGAGGPYLLETGADGTACVDHLAFGAYTVTETAAPGGYFIDDAVAKNVTVSVNQGCAAASVGANLAFSDTPKTDIDVSADSQDDGAGGTLTTITCKDDTVPTPLNLPGSPTSNVHNPSLSVDNLKPGTYTCTLVIDP